MKELLIDNTFTLWVVATNLAICIIYFYLWVNLYQCRYLPLVSWVNAGSQ